MLISIILVVEDNVAEQYVLKELLGRFDYEAVIVASGEEAIDALRSQTFEAVLMDLMLPGMDGYECTRRIREFELRHGRKRTPIIALTARTASEDRHACFRAGMDDHMSKPFDPEELRKMLLRWVYVPANPNLKVLPRAAEKDNYNSGTFKSDNFI